VIAEKQGGKQPTANPTKEMADEVLSDFVLELNDEPRSGEKSA